MMKTLKTNSHLEIGATHLLTDILRFNIIIMIAGYKVNHKSPVDVSKDNLIDKL
jgi:hypothetical protein